MQWRRQEGCDSLGTCLFSARPQRKTSRAAQCHRLIPLLDDAREELTPSAKWKAFTDNADAVACGQCEVIGLQQFCTPEMHIEGAGGRLHGNVRAERRGRRIFRVAQDDALQRDFAARIVRLSLRRNALRPLLRAKSHGKKHSRGKPSGNEAESNQSVHFPFPTQESPVGFPKISEQPNLERSALFVLILVGWTLRRLRLRFWTPHVPKCKHCCNDEDGHHPTVRTPLKKKGFSRS